MALPRCPTVGKVAYPDRRRAQSAANRLRAENGRRDRTLTYYPCLADPSHWHVGHDSPGAARRSRKNRSR